MRLDVERGDSGEKKFNTYNNVNFINELLQALRAKATTLLRYTQRHRGRSR